MSNYNIDAKYVFSASNIAALTVKNRISSYESAMEASKRFLRSSQLLSDNEMLGCQLNIHAEGSTELFVFSSEGTRVTLEDFRWIFGSYATVEEASQGLDNEFFSSDRFLYALQCTGSCFEEIFYNYDTNEYFKSYRENHTVSGEKVRRIFDVLKNKDVAVRILSGNEFNARMILISTSCPIPLRIRAMISLILQDATLVELDISDGMAKEVDALPLKYIFEVYRDIVEVLVVEAYKKERKMDDRFDEEEVDEELDFENEAEPKILKLPCTPIERLNLSPRAYRCLSRAGISRVEQLLAMDDEDYMKVRNLGKKSTEEIKQKLMKMLPSKI
ncbi:MAG: DNA-directed RNA polymerase subunit alpha C-terminal domain-containing protein [Filifactor alocis]|nr:DNA-directed RNA polymerase subunit alpha C-terminal domain-containing protein [Filifactor alocis]